MVSDQKIQAAISDAGVKRYLQLAEVAVDDKAANEYGPFAFNDSEAVKIQECVSLHADAFQAGLIDAARLLEVVVEPAVKLARKLNQLGPEAATAPFAESSVYIPGVTPQLPDQAQKNNRDFAMLLFCAWAAAVFRMIFGERIPSNGARLGPPVLLAGKRAELLEAMERSKTFRAMSDLLVDAQPVPAMFAIHALDGILYPTPDLSREPSSDPSDPPPDPSPDPSVCRATFMRDSRTIENLLGFWFNHGVTKGDMGQVALRARDLFSKMATTLNKGSSDWSPTITGGHEDSTTQSMTFNSIEGCPEFRVAKQEMIVGEDHFSRMLNLKGDMGMEMVRSVAEASRRLLDIPLAELHYSPDQIA